MPPFGPPPCSLGFSCVFCNNGRRRSTLDCTASAIWLAFARCFSALFQRANQSFCNRNFKNGPKNDPKMAQTMTQKWPKKGPKHRKCSFGAAAWFLLGAGTPKLASKRPLETLLGRPWPSLGASLALLGPVLGQPDAPKKPKEPSQMAPGPPRGSPKRPDWTRFCLKRDNKKSEKTCGFIVFFGHPAT